MKKPLSILNPAQLWNLAGILTLVRLPLAIVFPFIAADPSWALGVLLLAALTDILDGWVARLQGTVSHLGGFVDGWIDKIFNINAGWSLVVFDWMPWWLAVLLFTREWVQIPMVPYYVQRYMRGNIPPNRPLIAGKIASVLLVVAMVASLLSWENTMYISAALVSVLGGYSGVYYFVREFELFSQSD
ncbi:MAG: CDP-alcohol phosphatidyltransferase family protein [Myxococcota bacterium]|nr:CDP-alcohol phosphatidyltransferase family protein [Myxococcota bacterium]